MFLKDLMLPYILPNQDITALSVYVIKILRAYGEQNSPPQAQEVTYSPPHMFSVLQG